jgi:signal transduction histidine kinase
VAVRAEVEDLLEEIPQALTETLDGVNRVATIVRAMKALGHPGGEGKSDADLNEAIRNALVVAANEIRPVADVVTELADLPPVLCNLGDLNQVVLNLVINACHAMADRPGEVRGTLTVRTLQDGDDVLIEVQDTGTGIPAEIADRIFDPFFTTKDVGRGTGQGLALAHTLIHQHHGGTIGFDSTPGVGTTFTIRLPNRREAAEQCEAPE